MVKNSFSNEWKFWIWQNVKNGVLKGVLKEMLLDHEFNIKIIELELYPEILEHIIAEDLVTIPNFENIQTQQTEEVIKATKDLYPESVTEIESSS